ncbi:MAG: PQQ-binding-like beta-propeller repeat protein [Acidobacteriota bacterium]
MSPITSLRSVVSILLLLGLSAPLAAENWPHWRGPRFDGTSEATGLPTEWGKDKNLKWRLELPGDSAATPIVWGDRIFLTSTTEGSQELLVMAVDPAGKVVWKKTVAQGAYDFRGGLAQFRTETSPASPSPVTDGKHLWVLFGSGTLVSLDLDGNEVWRVDLEQRYGKISMYFGLSSSPFLSGNRLFVQALNTNGQLVVALDKATGKELWKHERATDARAECLHSYTSPQTLRSGGQELLLIHGADYVSAHQVANGAEVWRHGGLNPKDGYNPSLRLVATPVYADGLLVVPSAKRGPVYGLDPTGAKGEITGAEKHTRWHLERGTPDVPSPLVQDGLVYLSGENGRLTCLDAKSGETVYAERVHSGPHRGSPVYADGKIFLVATDGTVSVIRAGKKYELLAKNTVDERLAASLAIADGVIYLRSYEALYAIGGS